MSPAAVVAVAEAALPNPWPLDVWVAEFERRDVIFEAVAQDADVIGFAHGRYFGGEAQLMNIAVMPAHQREGCGRDLLGRFVARCAALQVQRVTLEVRASNRAALALYARAGFTEFNRRRGYYGDTGEDAVEMVRGV